MHARFLVRDIFGDDPVPVLSWLLGLLRLKWIADARVNRW